MSLVYELIKELVGDNPVTAVYGGGFKPPIYGHFSIVEKALKEFPEIDKFIIYVGAGVRDGISQEESLLVWNIYKKYLGDKIEIVPSKGPIGDVIRYGKNNPDEIVYFVIGGREGREDDAADIALRTQGIEDKYPNMKVKALTTSNPEMSGTNARKAIKVSEEEFYKFLPPQLTDEEKMEVYTLVSPVVKEQLNENASYSKDIDIIEKCAQLTNYMRDKGYKVDPLPSVEFVNGDTENAKDFFGKTAYYDPNEQKIVLYTEGRHPKDIVRSYAHEMIHHIQNIEGRLGAITTQNTQEDDHLNDIEAEANLKGTMTFRNWTDSLQEKKVKDPFGLNAFARELARDLEEALSIGGKEVERIDKPTNNPEDATVIYKDGTSEPYLDTVKEGRKKKKDPKKGTGKKPEGSGRRLYTDEDPKDTVGVSFRTKEDIVDTLNKKSFKAKSHARQSQVINLIHQRVRAAYNRAKDSETKSRLKRGLDYIEKRKEASKAKTKRLQAQKESLSEGRYDSISRQLASIALNSWKSDFKDGASYGYFVGEITPEEYSTDLTFTFKALGRFVDGGYKHNGYSKSDGEVGVKYEIPKDAIPQIWEEVYMDLISTIRHEIEHQTQGGKNVKQGKEMTSDKELRKLIAKGGNDIVKYVTLPSEIESNVNGLYLKAKKWRRPYEEVVDEYIKDFLKVTNPADINYVKSKWQEVAKKRSLPSLLNEGRYDKFVNQLSRIVFEMFKDIHDRGDKKGEFEFSVGPDDEDIYSKDFEFDLAGVVEITDDLYKVDGGANAGFDDKGEEITPLLSVKFNIPKNPDWQKISFDIKDVVRHELEHLTQDGENVKGVVVDPKDSRLDRPGKQMADDQFIRDMIDADMLPKADYFKLEKEIDAMMQGLYFKAKKSKRPFKDVIDDYLATQPISKEEKEVILNLWRSRNKALNLPVFETKYKLGKVMREQEETPKQTYQIYCDMDGVLTDFDTQFKELSGGVPPGEYESKNGKDAFWALVAEGGVGYWVGMPWMPNGKQLWEYISKYNPIILSAPSKENESRLGKRLWVRNNLSPKPKLILASAQNKPNYSGTNRILIDDRPDTIANWNAQGGIGILFKSTSQVIEELKKLGL